MQLDSLKRIFELFCIAKYEFKSLHLSSGSYLNYVEICKPKARKIPADHVDVKHNEIANDGSTTLILMHGFGLGLGFFFANFDALANFQKSPFDRIVAIDWPGMGHSSRLHTEKPKRRLVDSFTWFNRLAAAKSSDNNKQIDPNDNHVNKSVSFFIDGLEEWFRVDKNISSGKQNYILAGHSLGGYLCSRFVLKYPDIAKGLILISPVGLNAHPDNDRIIDPLNKHLFTHWGVLRASSISALTLLWGANLTPQALLRIFGDRGINNVHGFIERRFRQNNWDELKRATLAKYIHDISVAEPSGEYAMNSLLRPIIYLQGVKEEATGTTTDQISIGVFARHPLHQQIPKISIPMLLIYGDNDWLRYENVQRDVALWKSLGANISYKVLDAAGHHLYLDNPDDFHRVLFDWVADKYR